MPAGVLLGALTLVLLHLQRRHAYWNFSEGVYAFSSRQLLHGGDLYGHVVAAQPPGLFVAGAGILALGDGLDWLRWAMGLVQLAGGLVAARVAWRLTGSALAAAVTPALVLLTPWAVHEHGTLTPELFAGPLVLGGALWAARAERSALGGALVAAAVLWKLPFVIPAVLVVLAAADRRRAAAGAAGLLLVAGLVTVAVFGTGVWDQAVLAQLGTGRQSLRGLAGYWAQGGWNLAALAALAAVAVARPQDLRDRALLRTSTAAAVGFLLTFLTTWKQGTGLNIVEPIETALVPLAVTGVWVLARRRPRAAAAAALAAGLVLFAQTASLLLEPRTDGPFLYPTSQRGAWGRAASSARVDAEAARARRCPAGVPYSGQPLVAFVAGRPMPDDQPDLFLATRAPRLGAVGRAIAADARRCPQPGP